jgi:hypothetical protein
MADAAADGPPARVELAVGEERAIELPGLGTAGYVWDHEVTGDEGVADVTWTRGFPPGTPMPRAGVSAPEVATVRGRSPGTVTLRLYQHRRWEPPEQARAEHRIEVVVHS